LRPSPLAHRFDVTPRPPFLSPPARSPTFLENQLPLGHGQIGTFLDGSSTDITPGHAHCRELSAERVRVGTAVRAMVQGAYDDERPHSSENKGITMGLLDKAKEAAEGLKDKAEDLVDKVGDKVPDGLKDKVDAVKNKIEDVIPGDKDGDGH
jgi:hypothetical protein